MPEASGVALGSSSFELELLLELLDAALGSSSGNGKSVAAFFFAAALGSAAAFGAALSELGAGEVAGVVVSSGNGNFSIVLGLLDWAGFVTQGTGCGATVHGAVSAGALCATHATPAQAAHRLPATTILPRCLRITIAFQFRRFVRP
jgi:hypothetical protein